MISHLLRRRLLLSQKTETVGVLGEGTVKAERAKGGKVFLKIGGNTLQKGSPSPESPCSLLSLEKPTVTVLSEDGKKSEEPLSLRLPLRGTGSVCDTFSSDGTVELYLSEVTFDGREDWQLNTYLTGVNRFHLPLPQGADIRDTLLTEEVVCTHFDNKKTLTDGNARHLKNLACHYKTELWLYTDPVLFPDLESFKAFLKTSPMTVVYRLKTPVTVKETPFEPLLFKGNNTLTVKTADLSSSKLGLRYERRKKR